MDMLPLPSIAALHERRGQPPRFSPWLVIDQQTIDRFADVTHDHQWIHVDVERAQRESPHGRTIAHGFLSLALLPHLLSQVFSYPGRKSSVNYGFDRVRFTAAVPVGAQIRAAVALAEVHHVRPDEARVAWDLSLEVNGSPQPALVARWLVLMKY